MSKGITDQHIMSLDAKNPIHQKELPKAYRPWHAGGGGFEGVGSPGPGTGTPQKGDKGFVAEKIGSAGW